MQVTAERLSQSVEFDCPFEVFVSKPGHIFSADVYAPTVTDEEIDSDNWEFFSAGYTGQHGYSGPVMHNSEQLSGRLAEDILANPGVYVVVPCYWLDDHDCPFPEDCDGPDVEGWAVLKLIEKD